MLYMAQNPYLLLPDNPITSLQTLIFSPPLTLILRNQMQSGEKRERERDYQEQILTLCNSVVAFPRINITAFSFSSITTCLDLTNVASPNNFEKGTKE